MPIVESRVSEKTQDGKVVIDSSSNYVITNTDSGLSLDPGNYYFFRFPLPVPANATIAQALFQFDYTPKDTTKTQSNGITVYIGGQTSNSPRWPDSSPYTIPSGVSSLQFPSNPADSYLVDVSFTANEASPKRFNLDMKSAVQTIVNMGGYKPGNYISVIVYCRTEASGSDLAIQARDNDFAFAPGMRINYTPQVGNNRKWDVNILLNQTFEQGVSGVYGNSLFSYPDGVGIDLDGSKAHSGLRCLRVTAPAPVSGRSGFNVVVGADGAQATAGESWIYCGWCWIPSYIPQSNQVAPDLGFAPGAISDQTKITVRDQWVPFCTEPTVMQNDTTLFANFAVQGTTPQGWQFWLDDVCLMRSNVRQMPFTGSTNNKYGMSYSWTDINDRGTSVRSTQARDMINGKLGQKFVKRADGMWVRANSELRA